jgi:hypothetical protein
MSLFGMNLFAQRGGAHPAGGKISAQPLPIQQVQRGRFQNQRSRNAGGGVPWVWAADYGDYGFDGGYVPGYAQGYMQQSSPCVVMPQPPEPPPPPATPVIQEYHWAPSPNPPQPFSIVMNDSTVHLALMVWEQYGRLYFNSPEGGARQVLLSAVSRERTQAANAKKGLHLPLP